MKTTLLGVVAALALLCGRAEAVTISLGVGNYTATGFATPANEFFDGFLPVDFSPSFGLPGVPYSSFVSTTFGMVSGFDSWLFRDSSPTPTKCVECHSPNHAAQIWVSTGGGFQLSGSQAFSGFSPDGTAFSLLRPVFFRVTVPDGVTIFSAGVPVSPVPLPASLPLFATAFGIGGLLWRKRATRHAPAFA